MTDDKCYVELNQTVCNSEAELKCLISAPFKITVTLMSGQKRPSN